MRLNIYKNYNLKDNFTSKLILPLSDIETKDFDDTYGASRPGGRKHQGIDLFCDYGTGLLSVIDGTIVYTGQDNLGGKVVYLLGNDNRLYYYAHLSGFADIKINQKVKQGTVIGYAGNSGNAWNTPTHLHFEVMVIKWLFPYVYGNINPYPILVNAIKNSTIFSTL